MHVHFVKIIRHQRKDRCNQAMGKRLQRWDVKMVQMTSDMKLSLNDRENDPLEEGAT